MTPSDHVDFFLFRLDPSGRLLWANRAALQAANVRLAEHRGSLFWETPWLDVDAAHRRDFRRRFLEAARGRTVSPWDTLLWLDGRAMRVEMRMGTRLAAGGQVAEVLPHAAPGRYIEPGEDLDSSEHVLATFRDLMASIEKADDHLRMIEGIIEGIHVPITVVGVDGELIMMNAAGRRITGPEFDMGRVSTWDPIYRREDGTHYATWELPLARSLLTGDRIEGEYLEAQWQPGVWSPLRVTSWRVETEEGKVIGAVAYWPSDGDRSGMSHGDT